MFFLFHASPTHRIINEEAYSTGKEALELIITVGTLVGQITVSFCNMHK